LLRAIRLSPEQTDSTCGFAGGRSPHPGPSADGLRRSASGSRNTLPSPTMARSRTPFVRRPTSLQSPKVSAPKLPGRVGARARQGKFGQSAALRV